MLDSADFFLGSVYIRQIQQILNFQPICLILNSKTTTEKPGLHVIICPERQFRFYKINSHKKRERERDWLMDRESQTEGEVKKETEK